MSLGLNNALSIATSGLSATQQAMAVASQNVANAGTSGYIKEIANVQSNVAGGIGYGVSTVATTLATNDQLQRVLYAQNADVANYQATSNSLSAITALQGSTSADSGSSGTLSDLLGNVQSDLLSLSSTPTSSSAQSSVVSAAQSLVQSVNTLGKTYQNQRQSAQDSIVSTVSDINTNLTTIGTLSTQIMTLKASGQSTADLENQRFTALSSLSSEIGVNWRVSGNGDMTITTTNGTTLPTHNRTSAGEAVSSTWPLTTSSAEVTVDKAYPGTTKANAIPGIMLNGRDVTSSLSGGSLGANITLRDTTLPTMQAQLDAFASTTANRFQAQGMTLFTTSTGTLPGSSSSTLTPAGTLGFAQDMQVSATYTADPSQLVNGSAGSTTTVTNVLQYAFGLTLADGTAQPSSDSSSLGLNGNLSTGYSGNQTILDLATTLTSSQAATANSASNSLTLSQTSQSNISTSFNTSSGVSVDTEMANVVSLQNAYAANAKVVSTVQSMFSALLNAVGS
ncbi:flagellar hook-associated protein FlgK [Gluconobacter wancherniae]|uniref:flagellar hook-associated protein FlgK n=1 Tax=Gluconobacter wancherniae TaxID=1307955 RepID=UPI001B8CF795|nr:flagellar hook-associated protein FlgK [Gluconobacter wancherniae]MBS1095378.1 flagellar hook-associated protein FlgK [Gluconobacter wancherniae]